MEKQRSSPWPAAEFIDPLHEAERLAIADHEDSVDSVYVKDDSLKRSHTKALSNSKRPGSSKRASPIHCSEGDGKLFGGIQPYMKEWEKICRCCELKEFKSWALKGELSSCRFRSVCWRVVLMIFPTDSSNWQNVIRATREKYENTRHQLLVTPGSLKKSLDPNVDNPLSQDEESPWNQYFEDSELKRLIRLDVQRTFPEVEFFQSRRIQEMLVSILFCYARKYPHICYIQGMHEVLAPIAFVLNYDSHMFNFSDKDSPPNKLLQEIMDEAYLEHDSFTLFEAVMEKLHYYYEDGEPKTNNTPRMKVIPTQPFARPQDIGPTTKIVKRLTKIHNDLVKKHEPEILSHLNKLEIPPQVYGIRWTRLMFGREFAFTDLLVVWDAIFSDSLSNFLIIKYLMVAMLSNIKDKLLASDYITSLNLLMRYPAPSDVQSIIEMAVYFRSTNENVKLSFPGKCETLPSNLTTVGGQQNIHRAPQPPHSLHGSVTRSTSLPRSTAASSSTSTSLKNRSTSVEQPSIDRRKSSPTVQANTILGGVSYSTTNKTSPQDEESKGSDNSATTRMVSGLVRLGEKLGRNRETPSPQPDNNGLRERPMAELKFLERSAPIPTQRHLASGGSLLSQPNHNSFTSSSEGEEDPSFPQKNIPFQRVFAEDVISATIGCALKLSHHHANLGTRLAQLNIESDFTIRAAMEGISEVIEELKELKGKSRRNSENRKGMAASQPKSLPVFTHPLMDADYNDS